MDSITLLFCGLFIGWFVGIAICYLILRQDAFNKGWGAGFEAAYNTEPFTPFDDEWIPVDDPPDSSNPWVFMLYSNDAVMRQSFDPNSKLGNGIYATHWYPCPDLPVSTVWKD